MVLEDWKIKVSVLWLIYEMALFGYMQIGSLMPGVLGDLIDTGKLAGLELTPEVLLVLAILLLVPLLMAFVTFVLKDTVDRWANVIVGGVFFVIELVELGDLVANPFSAAMTLIWVWKTVVPLLIIWYAWRSRQKA